MTTIRRDELGITETPNAKKSAAYWRDYRARKARESGDFLECLECGQTLRAFTNHLLALHGMSVREYEDRHSLPVGTRGVAPGLQEWMRQTAPSRPNYAAFVRRARGAEHIASMRSNVEARCAKAAATRRGRPISAAQREANVSRLDVMRDRRKETTDARAFRGECRNCGAKFRRPPSEAGPYCSRVCYLARKAPK